MKLLLFLALPILASATSYSVQVNIQAEVLDHDSGVWVSSSPWSASYSGIFDGACYYDEHAVQFDGSCFPHVVESPGDSNGQRGANAVTWTVDEYSVTANFISPVDYLIGNPRGAVDFDAILNPVPAGPVEFAIMTETVDPLGSPIPEPATMGLFGLGLMGVALKCKSCAKVRA